MDWSIEMETVTTHRIGGKLYFVTSKCSPAATETIEKKLERLILRHISDKKSYQSSDDIPLELGKKVREYGTHTIIKE